MNLLIISVSLIQVQCKYRESKYWFVVKRAVLDVPTLKSFGRRHSLRNKAAMEVYVFFSRSLNLSLLVPLAPIL